ncbi:MAG: hypothetical protein KBT48_00330 [Firmicutes bacterium]|nr:hypothetical protein [Bacillota bacterium]
MTKININRNHKDTLFRKLFCEEQKENVLSLYNALNNSSYTNVDDLTINILDDVIYMKMKNDLSFLIHKDLFLIEHQSTVNPNMPLRAFFYFSRLYEGFIEMNDLNIYLNTLVKIPTPNCVVLYNGSEEIEAVLVLRLSSMFENEDKTKGFEWSVTVYNINPGKNEEFLNKCPVLKGYMTFVNTIRNYQKAGNAIREAVDKSMDYCIRNNVLEEFFKKHRSEVSDMVLTEFDEEKFYKALAKESEEKGIIIGKKEEKVATTIRNVQSAMRNGNMSLEEAMKLLDIPKELQEECRKMIK